MDDDPGSASRQPRVTVYWRPGCFFCRRLLRGLESDGVNVELRNIWEDDEAMTFVRSHNRGDETVPTVAVGTAVWTNPDVRTVTEAVRAQCADVDLTSDPRPTPGRRTRLFGRR